jgi:serine/threonine protein kinase
MSLSFWSSVSAGPSPVPSTPPRSAALDLLVALKSANLQVFTSADLRIKSDAVLIAGLGGFSRIEVGSLPSDRSKLVAVKHSSLFPRSYAPALPDAYDKHLVQLTLELRILSHNKLRQHPNILKVLGICVNDINLAQSLSLACELSEVGSLRSLLLKQGSQLSLNQHIDLISQVGKGLEAVHCLGVAHGDVKIENALIFYEQDSSLLVRICDFGQSCVHLADEKFSAAPINPPQGTPLLNAPEIRNGECFHAASFTIKDAILTDIFSFGLLAWEVLKDGKRYFDLNWPDYKESDPELDSMVQYLNELPRNQLCHYGLNFLKSRGLGNIDQSSGFYKAVESCLQDDPDQRQPMSTVVELIDTSKINLEIV